MRFFVRLPEAIGGRLDSTRDLWVRVALSAGRCYVRPIYLPASTLGQLEATERQAMFDAIETELVLYPPEHVPVLMGFGTRRLGVTRSYVCPLWTPSIVFGTYPALAFIRGPVRRRRRPRNGWCVQCG